jgi:hypothetical protein
LTPLSFALGDAVWILGDARSAKEGEQEENERAGEDMQ